MRLAVIGLGKLGLCTACCLARGGHEVVGMDVRADYVAGLNAGRVPFFETGLEALLAEVTSGGRPRLTLTTDLAAAVAATEACLIIVPTPSGPDGAFDNAWVRGVLEAVGPLLAGRDDFYVVDVVSTVMPGSCEGEFIPLLERLSGRRAGRDFGLAYNPEFIAIGSVIENFLNPDLVLLGESDPRTGALLEAVYRDVCDNEPHMARTGLTNAEIAKLSINCFCTMKISFANNLAALCEGTPGADAAAVADIVGRDSRIGGKYLRPGLGFGGPCFPRDNEAFIRFADGVGGFPGLQRAVLDINARVVERLAGRILAAARGNGLPKDRAPVVALLGQAYKPHTYLTERSQALDIARRLAELDPGLSLRAFDPLAREAGPWTLAESLEACVAGADVAAVLTPWPEFLDTAWRVAPAAPRAVVDCWS